MEPDFGDLLDRVPCGIVSFGDEGILTYINTTLLDRLSYKRDDLIGQHVERLFSVGTKIFFQTHLFPLVRMHGRAQEVFMLLRAREGEDVGMLCNAVRHERNGRTLIDCVFTEVAERRKFEEALLAARQAADTANVALEARTQEAEDAAHQLESQALELELQHLQVQEQAAELEAQSEALKEANDRLQVLNEDLEKQRAAADEANHAKSNFLAVMSHELRTPLNAIGGYAQLLEMGVHGPITDPQMEALGRINRSQRHLLRLINDVLNLSRIEAGRVEYVVESFPLAEVISNTTLMVEPQMSRKKLHFEVVVQPNLKVNADREKLQQILLNLLTNAVKFTPEGGSVRVEARESSPARAFLCVSDTGMGIPSDMLDKIFEPFIQVDASKSRATEGTGLGLAISRDLARGMGGDLSAESTLGKGSVFRLELQRG